MLEEEVALIIQPCPVPSLHQHFHKDMSGKDAKTTEQNKTRVSDKSESVRKEEQGK